jgi:hypothetical protein
LEFVTPLIQDGTLMYLDDWFCGYGGRLNDGVAGAFYEFIERNSLRSDQFSVVGYWGKAFVLYH